MCQVAGRRKRETGGGTPVSANIGGTQDCGPKDEVCNGPLDPSAEYQVRYRLFVGAQFQDYNNYVTFTTRKLWQVFNKCSQLDFFPLPLPLHFSPNSTIITITIIICSRHHRRHSGWDHSSGGSCWWHCGHSGVEEEEDWQA